MFGIDCFGSDILRIEGVQRWQSCALNCNFAEFCTYWSWSTTSDTCWLKNDCKEDDQKRSGFRISGARNCVEG